MRNNYLWREYRQEQGLCLSPATLELAKCVQRSGHKGADSLVGEPGCLIDISFGVSNMCTHTCTLVHTHAHSCTHVHLFLSLWLRMASLLPSEVLRIGLCSSPVPVVANGML